MGMLRGSPVLALLLAAAALVAPRAAGAQQIGLPIGARPDPVQLEDLDGNVVDLADYIGHKPVFIEFWATWCPLCERLQPRVDEAYERFGDQVEFFIVAVGVNQTPRSIRRHIERHAMHGRMLFDARGHATRAFAAPTTSYVVVLDTDGRVVYTGMGDDQNIVAAVERALPVADAD